MKKFNKLVRDLIPEIIMAEGREPKFRKLNNSEFKQALLIKLLEESTEVVEAKTKTELIKELADVQEVISAICEINNIASSDVTKTATKRRKERGGFKKKIFLESIN